MKCAVVGKEPRARAPQQKSWLYTFLLKEKQKCLSREWSVEQGGRRLAPERTWKWEEGSLREGGEPWRGEERERSRSLGSAAGDSRWECGVRRWQPCQEIASKRPTPWSARLHLSRGGTPVSHAAVCPLDSPPLPLNTQPCSKRGSSFLAIIFFTWRNAVDFDSTRGEERSRQKSRLPGLGSPRMALCYPEPCGA